MTYSIPQKIPAVVPGTRDFMAAEVFRRNYMTDTMKTVQQQYGFTPLETPALERLSTLTNKYGEDGEQLLFKVLNSGDFLSNVDIHDKDYKTLLPQIATRGLRYDLTVPLMRYVAMHKGALVFPFKRYQIQPVWRADRPQKGRYREFYQCDMDIVGASSLLCEAEILVIVHQILRRLGVKDFTIHLNHRDVLKKLTAHLGISQQHEAAFCTILDKLDKIGQSKVLSLLQEQGLSPAYVERLLFIFNLPSQKTDRWTLLNQHLGVNKGMQEMQQIIDYIYAMGIEDPAIMLDPTLARGLDYYTGTIFEVKIAGEHVGSIGGGGRYDGLTDLFGLPGIAGVGFSFGLDRLYHVLETRKLFPNLSQNTPKVLLVNLARSSEQWALQVLMALRNQGIPTELYPEYVQLKRSLRYANYHQVPFVAIIGEEEHTDGKVTLKNMQEGTQQLCTLEQICQTLS